MTDDSLKQEKLVPVKCLSGDGETIYLPEEVAAVLGVMGYRLYFVKSFCDVERANGDSGKGRLVRSYSNTKDPYDWTHKLNEWVREGCPDKEEE